MYWHYLQVPWTWVQNQEQFSFESQSWKRLDLGHLQWLPRLSRGLIRIYMINIGKRMKDVHAQSSGDQWSSLSSNIWVKSIDFLRKFTQHVVMISIPTSGSPKLLCSSFTMVGRTSTLFPVFLFAVGVALSSCLREEGAIETVCLILL